MTCLCVCFWVVKELMFNHMSVYLFLGRERVNV